MNSDIESAFSAFFWLVVVCVCGVAVMSVWELAGSLVLYVRLVGHYSQPWYVQAWRQFSGPLVMIIISITILIFLWSIRRREKLLKDDGHSETFI